jgi:hypothetical protein
LRMDVLALRGPLRGHLRVRTSRKPPHPEVRAKASLEGEEVSANLKEEGEGRK